jgi:hypothetical protein
MSAWKLRRGNQESDLDLATLLELARSGRVLSSDYVFNPVLMRWMYAKEVEELAHVFSHQAALAKRSHLNSVSWGLFIWSIFLLFFSPLWSSILFIAAVVVAIVYHATSASSPKLPRAMPHARLGGINSAIQPVVAVEVPVETPPREDAQPQSDIAPRAGSRLRAGLIIAGLVAVASGGVLFVSSLRRRNTHDFQTSTRRATTQPEITSAAAPSLDGQAGPDSVEWKRVSLGTGVSVELPPLSAADISRIPDSEVFDAASYKDAVFFGVKVLRGAAQSGANWPDLVEAVYKGQRASGGKVTETARGSFGGDMDARRLSVESAGNWQRWLLFRRGRDLMVFIASTSPEKFDAAQPALNRFFESVQVVGTVDGHFGTDTYGTNMGTRTNSAVPTETPRRLKPLPSLVPPFSDRETPQLTTTREDALAGAETEARTLELARNDATAKGLVFVEERTTTGRVYHEPTCPSVVITMKTLSLKAARESSFMPAWDCHNPRR